MFNFKFNDILLIPVMDGWELPNEDYYKLHQNWNNVISKGNQNIEFYIQENYMFHNEIVELQN